MSQGLGEQRLSKQAIRSPTQGGLTPKGILTLEGGPEGGGTGLDLGESQAFEELSLGTLDECERQVSEG